MGTINVRVRSNGRKTYTAQIVKKRNGTTVLSISETFPKKAQANAWMARKEEEIAMRGLDAFLASGKTHGMAIERYRTEKAGLGRTATQVLRTLEADEIARLSCNEITPDKIYDLALRLRRTRKAQTVGNYLNTLSAVFRTAPRAFGIPLPRQAMLDALESCRSLGTIGKSDERDRRPTLEELDKLFDYFHARQDTSKVPMLEICFFAIFAARRLDEICRIRWSDLDEEESKILVRDMKHPRWKIGNHIDCLLPREAMALLHRLERQDERIFPHRSGTVSDYFSNACKMLDIRDLRFHDFRHEGASRLAELGWSIPQMSEVTGHRDWKSVQRYTHGVRRVDEYAGWAWIDRLLEG